MNLKTLNDLVDYSKHQTGNRVLVRLKEEAIRWIKHWRRLGHDLDFDKDKINPLIFFLDITEKDLK